MQDSARVPHGRRRRVKYRCTTSAARAQSDDEVDAHSKLRLGMPRRHQQLQARCLRLLAPASRRTSSRASLECLLYITLPQCATCQLELDAGAQGIAVSKYTPNL